VTEVDVTHEAVPLEQFEVAVDRGDVDRERLGKLRRRERAIGDK
jgi:hypothetical protein